jgi:hypothetical protein
MVELTGFTKIFAAFGVPGLVVGIVYLMLRYWKFRIVQVPATHAATVVIVIILVIGGLTYKLIDVAFEPGTPDAPPKVVDRDLRFETKYEEARFYQINPDKIRGDFTVRFLPTTTDNGQAATIFIGIAKIHDDEKVLDIADFAASNKRCDESASCLHAPLVWNWDRPPGNERIVRGSTNGTRHTFSAVFDRGVKRLLVSWEFYQREGDNGARCEVDASRPSPRDGLPVLHSVKDGKMVHGWCYKAWERQVVPVTISM